MPRVHHLTAAPVLGVAAAGGVATVFFDAADLLAALPLSLAGSGSPPAARYAVRTPPSPIGWLSPLRREAHLALAG